MGSTYLIIGVYSICMIVLVVLWLQSGLDKIFNYKGNLDWLTGHFSKSFLRNMVPFMLISLTILELGTGILALCSVIEIIAFNSWKLPIYACSLTLFTLTLLFSAQRIAKDYAGAARLMGYFIFTMILFLFTFYVAMMMRMSQITNTPISF